ncbi:TetR/AcrR family transcriptional regulator [Jiella sonneratiae]|uniref:TetR/AcrR family transcriptional regulator n=1 Tax=Jiella sonneratiae TaxID=2816856 RepID=A0ABS3J2Y5_9HYPH|nr:TetR/AcrR family transcriptional regulator [Jiella sonneratiae]MBO0904019.1 TetR/AcrR family transcriptional regulator [Jiella sonneratiae]
MDEPEREKGGSATNASDALEAPQAASPRRRPPRRERDFAAIREAEDKAFRRRILAAAAEIFAERGFASASIDEVARRLSATKGLVYHRYRSKGELLADLCEDGLGGLVARVAAIAARREPAITRLAAAASLHAGDVLSRLSLHRTLASVTSGVSLAGLAGREADAVRAVVMRRLDYDATFARLIADAARERDLPAGRDVEMLARLFVAALDAPLVWPVEAAQEAATKSALTARQLAYFALRGIGASDATLREEFSR